MPVSAPRNRRTDHARGSILQATTQSPLRFHGPSGTALPVTSETREGFDGAGLRARHFRRRESGPRLDVVGGERGVGYDGCLAPTIGAGEAEYRVLRAQYPLAAR